jgi:4-amino-4-deoxy-L-arabinose transferase-like glycosyltransferase
LVDYLLANRKGAKSLVAVEGAQPAEPIIIDTGQPVMALRGFSGSDPWPTVSQFQALVTAGKVRYVLIGDSQFGGGQNGEQPLAGSSGGAYSDIEQWVTRHGTVVDPSRYGGTHQGGTLYQLW